MSSSSSTTRTDLPSPASVAMLGPSEPPGYPRGSPLGTGPWARRQIREIRRPQGTLVLSDCRALRRALQVSRDMLMFVSAGLRFLSPGYLIGDKYEVIQAVGSGGMGIVYEALHT